MSKPQYITAIENRMEAFEIVQGQMKETQDQFLERQGKTHDKLNEIHICLAGTEFDQQQINGKGGGIVKRLSNVEKIGDCMKMWKAKTKMRDKIIWIVFSASLGGVWTVALLNWKTIFGG